jgi:hypothetical protein
MEAKNLKNGLLKNVATAKKNLFLYTLFLFLPLCLSAQQQTIALIPFWGDNQNIISQFGDEVFRGLNNMGNFRPSRINMNPANLPDDVPEGGFPPFVCPSPSLTRNMPYALTGEIVEDPDTGGWSLRLYLWKMTESRLIFSDRLTAFDRETCRTILPGLLEWIFSWIPEDNPQPAGGSDGEPRIVYVNVPAEVAETDRPAEADKPRIVNIPTEADKWLYFGLRAGGGLLIHTDPWLIENAYKFGGNVYTNIHMALHMHFQPFNTLGLQVEGIFSTDSLEGFKLFETFTITLPVMVRFTLRKNSSVFSALGGIYFPFILGKLKDGFEYAPPPMGLTAGLQIGSKAGPGALFFDLRFSMDFTNVWQKEDIPNIYSRESGYHRIMINIGVGYELGVITKKGAKEVNK